ncbi:MAG: hypothetical protein HC904_16280 [Blastochloris sp.]|nr:hypothetical protein [Blastochloris sp.]
MLHLTENFCAGKWEAYTLNCGVKSYLKACGEVRQWDSRQDAAAWAFKNGYEVA